MDSLINRGEQLQRLRTWPVARAYFHKTDLSSESPTPVMDESQTYQADWNEMCSWIDWNQCALLDCCKSRINLLHASNRWKAARYEKSIARAGRRRCRLGLVKTALCSQRRRAKTLRSQGAEIDSVMLLWSNYHKLLKLNSQWEKAWQQPRQRIQCCMLTFNMHCSITHVAIKII